MALKQRIGGQECFMVEDAEVLTNGATNIGDQIYLAILKEAGAPIKGTFWLSVKPDFAVSHHRDELGRRSYFIFQKFKQEA
jgi:hypothetical protein